MTSIVSLLSAQQISNLSVTSIGQLTSTDVLALDSTKDRSSERNADQCLDNHRLDGDDDDFVDLDLRGQWACSNRSSI